MFSFLSNAVESVVPEGWTLDNLRKFLEGQNEDEPATSKPLVADNEKMANAEPEMEEISAFEGDYVKADDVVVVNEKKANQQKQDWDVDWPSDAESDAEDEDEDEDKKQQENFEDQREEMEKFDQ